MTLLTIGRLIATARVSAADADRLAGRLDRLVAGATSVRLEAAVDALDLPPGDWCLRRLDLKLTLDPDRPDSALESDWAAAVAFAAAAAVGSGDAVHYRGPADALTDLLSSLARGNSDRSWAWRQLGLFGPDSEAGRAGAAAAAALTARPECLVEVVATAVRLVGAAAVHRLLGTRGWQELGSAVLRRFDAGGSDALAGWISDPGTGLMTHSGPDPHSAAGLTGNTEAAPGIPRPARSSDSTSIAATSPAEAARRHAATVISRSSLARSFLDAGVRPGPAAAAWAVLCFAEQSPSSFSSAALLPTLSAAALALSEPATGHFTRPAAGPAAARRTDVDPPAQPPAAGKEGLHPERNSGPPAGNGPVPGTALRTEWGGLFFLITTATMAGIPAPLCDEPLLTGRQFGWILRGILVSSCGVPGTDSAVQTLCGAETHDDPASHAEAGLLSAYARRLNAATAAAMGSPNLDPARARQLVQGIARRRADIAAESGWIEVTFPMAAVDTAIRRAGLDLDPGWVPWLGRVVRYHYE
ncbi:hypothetical protein ASG92_22225 [Arthrobacter sp. Soil736]|uniref:hypothetical protein n=1 Tax=Arthrobacter sp. Soil736 TaxID=1736395 RepID=UPI0006FDDB57|nr:hypothetical protein [Arthrobacter sp. Soil736]KRE60003.1 hypothetical protein ASG92_22225 [Arthrobacter sp. Soil736]